MRRNWNKPRNVTEEIQDRESHEIGRKRVPRRCYINRNMVERLRLTGELEGHTGCVNCIQWNDSGTLLASGSDDFKVILWDPHKKKAVHTLRTGHTNNIFAVQFLPGTFDRVILSGAGDNRVRMHDLGRGSGEECVQIYTCHLSRVKRIAVTPTQEHLFWTAGEDGIVMQFDTRVPPICDEVCEHALINLNSHVGPEAEVKCVAINPCRPEYLAVGANDPFVRVFDRRMLSCRKINRNAGSEGGAERRHYFSQPLHSLSIPGEDYAFPDNAARYFCPGHLPMRNRKFRQMATTYLTFDSSGTELLVNLGGEQIYLFDFLGNQRKSVFSSNLKLELEATKSLLEHGAKPSNGHSKHSNGIAKHRVRAPCRSKTAQLDSKAELLKDEANAYFQNEQFVAAVEKYTEAISCAPESPILYANRAAAFMKRDWNGDTYAALRDCYATLKLDPNHLKALFRTARCLKDLDHPVEADICLEIFQQKFPEHTKSPAFKTLSNEVRDKVFSEEGSQEKVKRKRCKKEEEGGNESEVEVPGSPQDFLLKTQATDYEVRFCGHCNTTTDIKEANFFGRNGEYVVAGSDDGTFFIWDRKTTNIVSVMKGDESIVNCLQPHPTACLLATSGIQSVVKLWAPGPEDTSVNPLRVDDMARAAAANQRRMKSDPFELMLYNMYGISSGAIGEDGEGAEGEDSPSIRCRQS